MFAKPVSVYGKVERTSWVKSKNLTRLSWVDAHSNYVDICNMFSWLLEFSWCMSYKLLNMSLHSKLAFCKMTYLLVLYHALLYLVFKTRVACEYIQSTHWLATGYFIGQSWKNRIWWRILRRRTCELGRFPSQNACRVKADGMGPSYRRRFPLRSYTQDLTIMVIIYVRRYVWL